MKRIRRSKAHKNRVASDRQHRLKTRRERAGLKAVRVHLDRDAITTLNHLCAAFDHPIPELDEQGHEKKVDGVIVARSIMISACIRACREESSGYVELEELDPTRRFVRQIAKFRQSEFGESAAEIAGFLASGSYPVPTRVSRSRRPRWSQRRVEELLAEPSEEVETSTLGWTSDLATLNRRTSRRQTGRQEKADLPNHHASTAHHDAARDTSLDRSRKTVTTLDDDKGDDEWDDAFGHTDAADTDMVINNPTFSDRPPDDGWRPDSEDTTDARQNIGVEEHDYAARSGEPDDDWEEDTDQLTGSRTAFPADDHDSDW